MGYVVLHIEKAAGTDAAMSGHVERRITPANVITTLTYLNEELVEFPKGVTNRTEAIQHRLDNAGLERKIGKNQVRALRVMLSGSPEDMKRIRLAGQLDAWAKDSCGWLQKTFGKENVVSAVLHLDEKTPHIHATVVPIVRGERRKAKLERERNTAGGKRTYRTKKDRPRLCADDMMARDKLKAYQTTYAEAMAKYGLRRGIDGSEAKHISTQQFYREVKVMTDILKADIKELQKQKATTREELNRVKKEVQTERLKGAATSAATNIAESIGAMFGSNRVKALERDNIALHREAASYEETIEVLHPRIQVMQSDHSRELMTMQARHAVEVVNLTKQHEKEMSLMKTALSKAVKWFPYFREMIRMENVCRTAGFDDEQTATLLKGKLLEYSGELDSEGHNCKFTVERVAVRITPDPTDKRKLQLNIDKVPFKEWCREKFEKMRNAFCQSVQRQQKYKGPRF